MSEAMHIVRQTLGQTEARRDAMLNAFLNFRPDVVDVTSYDAAGQLLTAGLWGGTPRSRSRPTSRLTTSAPAPGRMCS